jgi:hypothetical protein
LPAYRHQTYEADTLEQACRLAIEDNDRSGEKLDFDTAGKNRRANIRSACASNGDTLPPRGFGAALRLSRQRCSHLTAELALMSKRSAASRRDARSISTASMTRCRRSPE